MLVLDAVTFREPQVAADISLSMLCWFLLMALLMALTGHTHRQGSNRVGQTQGRAGLAGRLECPRPSNARHVAETWERRQPEHIWGERCGACRKTVCAAARKTRA